MRPSEKYVRREAGREPERGRENGKVWRPDLSVWECFLCEREEREAEEAEVEGRRGRSRKDQSWERIGCV